MVRQEGTRREEFRAAYLGNHPTDIEDYNRAGGALPTEFLFKFPINKVYLAAGEKVHVVRSEDLGFANAINVSNVAKSQFGYNQNPRQSIANSNNESADSGILTAIRPKFSDDESTVFFGNRDGICWGKITKGMVLTCSTNPKLKETINGEKLTGGELSHDGNTLVFLTQVIYPPLKQSDKKERLCIVNNSSSPVNFEWFGDDDFTTSEVVLTSEVQ
jgi:hypothetical protein